MTLDENPALSSQLDAIEDFARRLTLGLGRTRHLDVDFGAATLVMTTAAGIAGDAPRGALLARTRWPLPGGERGGAIVWARGWEMLLEDEAKHAGLISAEEIARIDRSMRRLFEEDGEGPVPLDWSALEGTSSGEIAAHLEELGMFGELETVQIEIGAGESELRLLFLAGDPVSASAPRRSTMRTESPVARAAATTAPPALSRTADGQREEIRDLGNLHHLLDVKIPLRIRLGSTRMSLDELLRIAPGAILELDRREEEPLEVLANGRVIARGEVVVLGERLGLKITEIGSERIEAVG